MINKKILAASIAAVFTLNVSAAPIDLTDSATAVKYAKETIVNGGVLTNNAAFSALTDFTVPTGLNLPIVADGSEFFVRLELTNAKWDAIIDSANLTHASGTSLKVGGGGVADGYVVFDYEKAGGTTTSAELFSWDSTAGATPGLTITDTSKPVTVTYKLYQNSDSLAALNGGAGAVKETSLDIISFVTGQNVAGSFVKTNQIAQVSKQFTEVAGGKVATLGNVNLAVKATIYADNTSVTVAEADVYTPSAIATVTGDLSFGDWHVDTNAACTTTPISGTTVTIAADLGSGTVPALDYTSAQYLCVTVDGVEIIPRVTTAYSVALAGNTGVAGSLGSISYDTTAITIPYLTTFSDYNQRVYILNNSSVDAPYTTTFQTEAGVTATAGSAATGVVPAKTVLAIKSVDLVTFAGKTRGAAVIEIEATPTNVEATSQSVNLSDGSTDTLTLADQ